MIQSELMKYFFLFIPFFLTSCKSLGMDSFIHPHVTNHVNISLSDEIKKAVREQRDKEDQRLKILHDLEEKTLSEKHRFLEQDIRKIHDEAEKKSNDNFRRLEERLLNILALLGSREKQPQD